MNRCNFYRTTIANILDELQGAELRDVRQALRVAYPGLVRRGSEYRAWLREIRRQRGGRGLYRPRAEGRNGQRRIPGFLEPEAQNDGRSAIG